MVLCGYTYYLEIWILEETTHSSMKVWGIKYGNLSLFYDKAPVTDWQNKLWECFVEWMATLEKEKESLLTLLLPSSPLFLPSPFFLPVLELFLEKAKLVPALKPDFTAKSKCLSNVMLLYFIFPALFLSISPTTHILAVIISPAWDKQFLLAISFSFLLKAKFNTTSFSDDLLDFLGQISLLLTQCPCSWLQCHWFYRIMLRLSVYVCISPTNLSSSEVEPYPINLFLCPECMPQFLSTVS